MKNVKLTICYSFDFQRVTYITIFSSRNKERGNFREKRIFGFFAQFYFLKHRQTTQKNR